MAWAAAASAVIGAYGIYQGGKNAEAMAKGQAQADEYNAEIDRQNAVAAQQQANAREEAQRRVARQALGEQRAALSQAGIGLSGSAADIYRQSATNAELDALNIRYEGGLQTRGLLAQSELGRQSARMARINGRLERQGANLSAASTLFSGAATAYGRARTPSPGGGG
jgi:hypothetical protein